MTDLKTSTPRKIVDLKPHPRQYRSHPEEQIEHLMHSITENGFYRNIVISTDDYILGGHGAVEAMARLEQTEVTTITVPYEHDHPKALKILAADNYLSHFAEDDDRMLTELLREINEEDDLYGTGFDDQMLAAYAMVTRTKDEINDFDAAAEWAGMPDYEPGEKYQKLTIIFRSEADRDEFVEDLGLKILRKQGDSWSTRWPPEDAEQEDLASLRWESE